MKRKSLVLIVFVLLVSASVNALTVLQLNLEQLTALSEKVFSGQCVSVVSEKDASGRPVETVTFRVDKMLKGEPSDTVTFRQLSAGAEGVSAKNTAVQGVFRELPRYQKGEEEVIFLSEEGEWGLTAPIGLSQGKFKVTTSSDGQKFVANGLANRGLFMGWKKSPAFQKAAVNAGALKLVSHSRSGAPLPFEDFTSLVSKLAQGQ